MDEAATALGIMVFSLVCFIAFCGAIAGIFVFRRRKQPMWKGFILGGFSGVLAGMIILAITFAIIIR